MTHGHHHAILDVMTPKRTARFWSRVARRGDDECWLWVSPNTTDLGYGLLQGCVAYKKYSLLAHRIAFALSVGREPVGVVRHDCDTPACCNPRHLIEGSQAENIHDMHARGRAIRGNHGKRYAEGVKRAAIAFRLSGMTCREIASRFGCNYYTVVHWTKGAVGHGINAEGIVAAGPPGLRAVAVYMEG
jgi:hypothetical protein